MKGGEKMNISKVYYEELKSKCVNGKWKSIRIGAMVDVNSFKDVDCCLNYAKSFVREKFIEELGTDVVKEKKQKELLKALEEIIKEANQII